MDIGDLLILLIFAFPILRGILGNLRKAPQELPEGQQEEERESFFDRAIREIEAALEEADGGQRTPSAEPVPVPQRRPTRIPIEDDYEAGMDQFHDQVPGSFESKEYQEFRELTPVNIDNDLFSEFSIVASKKTGSGNRIRKMIKDGDSIKDAVLLSEILGPPHSMRSRPHRR